MNAKLNIIPGPSAVLEVLEGEEQGKSVELQSDILTLGRANDNDFVISSNAVSRYHAMLERTEDGTWYVRDKGSKNGVVLNGEQVSSAQLSEGDVVQIGDFVFRFKAEVVNHSPDGENAAVAPYAYEPGVRTAKSNKRIIIYGGAIALLALFWFLSSGNPPQGSGEGSDRDAASTAPNASTASDSATSSGKLARDFDLTPKPDLNNTSSAPKNKTVGQEDPVLTQAEQDLEKIDATDSPLKQAEAFFRRGLREYSNRNWGRAIDDFKTTISLSRGHELAAKYLGLATHESEVEAKMHMQNGIRYFESLQYQRAISDFEQVIVLMSHRPNEPIVGEATRYIQVCKDKLQAAELFP